MSGNTVSIDMDIATPQPEMENYEQQMAEKPTDLSVGDHTETDLVPQPAERPDNVPEKFWKDGQVNQDALMKSYLHITKQEGIPMDMLSGGGVNTEALLAAYAEAEKSGGAAQPEAQGTEDKPSEDTPEGEQKENPQDQPEAKKADPFNMDYVSEELATTGEVSAETMGKASQDIAERLGISEAEANGLMQMHLAGINAMIQQVDNAVSEAAGGQDIEQVFQWAAQNVDAGTLDALEQAMNPATMNIQVAQALVQQIAGQYTTINGMQGRTVGGERAAAQGATQAFRSDAEIQQAMADPRYNSDPAYRADVIRKISMMG